MFSHLFIYLSGQCLVGPCSQGGMWRGTRWDGTMAVWDHLLPQLIAHPRHGVTPAVFSPLQVGFLKILHKYEITFLLPLVQRLGKDVCAVPLPSLNLRVISVTPLPEGKVPPLSPRQLLCWIPDPTLALQPVRGEQ